jgi:adenylate cyclase
MSETTDIGVHAMPWRRAPSVWWTRLALRHPIVALFLVIIWPNALWSAANLGYNKELIIDRHENCADAQRAAFWQVAVPVYPTIMWVAGMAVMVWMVQPLRTYLLALEGKRPMTDAVKQAAQKLTVNLPWYQLRINFCLWLPGGVVFPALICLFGGTENGWLIAAQFLMSFLVSALVTTFQTFVLLERFLLVYLYPRVFVDVRPVEVAGARLLPFHRRLRLLWWAVSLGPIVVLALITFNLVHWESRLILLTVGVVVFAIYTGREIIRVVGTDLGNWLETHMAATHEIARENFDIRIAELRSDEWGRLTDSFNQMALDLSRGRHVHETFGHFVGSEVRDEILARFGGLGGSVEEITVMFADIRGFTKRSAGKPPEEVVNLLNRFLSLAVETVESRGGWVNKFLGDGFMALFGAPLRRDDHADLAVAAASDLLARLEGLNRELKQQGEAPLRIGIGVHSGPALVGCIGATVAVAGGREQTRKELTAIGETVNIAQRVEELTKKCGVMLLISDTTRLRMQRPMSLTCVGPHVIRDGSQELIVHTCTTG